MPLISIKRVTFYIMKDEVTIFYKTLKEFTIKCVTSLKDIEENQLTVPRKLCLEKSAITHISESEYEADLNQIKYIF